MTYGQVRASVLQRLNRDDCSNDLADGFIDEGIRRVQREARLPSMERVVWYDATPQPIETISVPADYLEGIEVTVDNVPLRKTSYRGITRVPISGAPSHYARYGASIYVRPPVPVGARVELLYYGNFSPLASDAAENEWTSGVPDLVMYAALSAAGDHFTHEKTSDWEARYQMTLTSVTAQIIGDEMGGGSMSVEPMYET